MRDPQTEALASDSAAGIVGAIETLVAMRLQGADVDRFILSAIDMLMGTKCLSYEDALAFISIG